MKKRVGLSATLGAIAMGMALSSAATPAIAQDAGDVDALCQLISSASTLAAFNAIPEAVAAVNDPNNPCFSVAVTKLAALSEGEDKTINLSTASLITPPPEGGYDFQ